MKDVEIIEYLDRKFKELDKRITDLEHSRTFMSGVWKALTVVGVVGVSVLGVVVKTKLF